MFAEILLQVISSVAHPRRDSAFDIILGLGKGFTGIGTLDGEAHIKLATIRLVPYCMV
jgi:hypothetical protein